MDNIRHVNLRVLAQYEDMFPSVTLGLSDHTPGHVTVLGAVALGARAVEKHFTDYTTRAGPDHGFSMDPQTWKAMVDDTRMLEAALGTGRKTIEDNEAQTVILQRRCVRAARDLPQGTQLRREDLEIVRPAPVHAVPAHDVNHLIGRFTQRNLRVGEEISWTDLS